MSVASRVFPAKKKLAVVSSPVILPGLSAEAVDSKASLSSLVKIILDKKYGAGGPSTRGSHLLAQAGGGCEVAWYYGRTKSLRPKAGVGSVAKKKRLEIMDFGTLVHAKLAYHYARQMARKPSWFLDYPDEQRALVSDAKGNNEWLKLAQELMTYYLRKAESDAWTPEYNEEEMSATVAEIDPNGVDVPGETFEYEGPCEGFLRDEQNKKTGVCPHTTEILDSRGVKVTSHVPHVVKRKIVWPNLNAEVITCRPDLIVRRNGVLFVIDHKTQGGGKGDNKDYLPKMHPDYPDHTYTWQGFINLHICRAKLGKDNVRGLLWNRIKRTAPFDRQVDEFEVVERQYRRVPLAIRQALLRERELVKKALRAPETLVPHYWACQKGFPCDFQRLCFSDTAEERNRRMGIEFEAQ